MPRVARQSRDCSRPGKTPAACTSRTVWAALAEPAQPDGGRPSRRPIGPRASREPRGSLPARPSGAGGRPAVHHPCVPRRGRARRHHRGGGIHAGDADGCPHARHPRDRRLSIEVSSLAMDRTVLTGATLLDGSGAPPVAGRAVVVEGGRIAAVVAEREAPAGTALRLDGLTLLPGLINCHVHL